MKFVIATCVLFFVVMTSVMASEPSQDAFENLPATFDEPIYEPAIVQRGDRHRRVTCDLLSFNTKWGSINHAACAAHCLAMRKGYRGGHCDGNGVCVCRK